MSLESVRTHFTQWNRENDVTEFETSSATVRIAKSLSFRGGDQVILIVAAGDAKIDNKKSRQTFGFKARMLSPNEVLEQTGHEIGGVCPFGLAHDPEVYLDVSLKRFQTVFPACGSRNSAIELTPKELSEFSFSKAWIDVCKD
ncbi:YbaK/EbsC family protein [Bacillus subtilis]|uniref:YbaK/EbsC family protein n=1 Tax=Bacillus subtilis TaxID=1423 RepID=UPI002DB95656|nr:YbaK/EbsC family protein [Bacillus subtilis]MEC1539341.1 YbaK/EbsC family protein [Bacillus subtilis]